MSICFEYLLVACIIVYIIDLSGFTQSWKGWVSRKFGGRCRIGKPFDCSLCMTWWVCLLLAHLQGVISIPLCAYIAALSLCADIIGQIIGVVKEFLRMALRHLYDLSQK